MKSAGPGQGGVPRRSGARSGPGAGSNSSLVRGSALAWSTKEVLTDRDKEMDKVAQRSRFIESLRRSFKKYSGRWWNHSPWVVGYGWHRLVVERDNHHRPLYPEVKAKDMPTPEPASKNAPKAQLLLADLHSRFS